MSKEMIVRLNEDRVKINGCEYVRDLIRCEDCRFSYQGNYFYGYACHRLGDDEHGLPRLITAAEDFCSYAEPKEAD